jgi:hypothetical protein
MVAIISACDDIFENNIEEKQLVLLSPGDSIVTNLSNIVFWWDPIDGAINYQLQVVTPNFKSAEKVVLDTMLSTNKFEYSLTPGKSYEWCVRALNSAYSTNYFYSFFTIDTTSSLIGQSVILTKPVNDFCTKDSFITVAWQKLNNATQYQVEVHKPDWNGTIYSSDIAFDDSIKLKFPEGRFAWGVRAWNLTSGSNFEHRNIVIDFTKPGKSIPAEDSSFTSWPVTLKWDRADDKLNGSPQFDSIYIANESTFRRSSIIEVKAVKNSTSHSFNKGTAGTYYWKLLACDEAGNVGDESRVQKIVVNSN